jgi:hypothetical protein
VGDDLLFALRAREGLGQADRLDDLGELALDRPALLLDEVLVQQPLAHELLGDRRGAACIAPDRVEAGCHDGRRVEPGVGPEALVLDRGGRIDHDRRPAELLERHDLAARGAEACQLRLAGPVVGDRLFERAEVRERTRVIELVDQALVGHHDPDGEQEPGHREEREEDHGNGAGGGDPGSRRAAGDGTGTGLHAYSASGRRR